ncbi:MAG: TetR/AcrR family transcriptional regulator, partial [Actinomadura rubrobrunea]|nr:TetR/AcrR family transcriptional regulator [Actinomadura rubrobrunea]
MPETGSRSDATPAPMGRRERKKAATRQAIADAALRLFLERGYDNVGIREIADAADVSTTTLFKHFPVKEALVFDREADLKAGLLAAVRERPKGQSIPAALREHALRHRMAHPDSDPDFASFLKLVNDTPALRDYYQAMWLRHTAALAEAIAEES